MSMLQMMFGSGGAPRVQDVFSLDLYTGDNTNNRDIVNDLDLLNDGGLVIVKQNRDNRYFVLSIGDNTYTRLPSTTAANVATNHIPGFNTDGFRVSGSFYTNTNGQTHNAWSFKAAPKFFDVVTWTGDGTGSRTLSHNLQTNPGVIILRTTTASNTYWYHNRNFTDGFMQVNRTNLKSSSTTFNLPSDPTSTDFSVPTGLNANNINYVAYVFAADTPNLIKCGNFTGNSGAQTIDIGFEPQFLFYKNASRSSNWQLSATDNSGNPDLRLIYQTNSNDDRTSGRWQAVSNGFEFTSGPTADTNINGDIYEFIAIAAP